MGTKATRVGRQKLALVIGIGDYDKVAKLKNPQNDANALASVLGQIGFIIDRPQLDKTGKELQTTIANFRTSIESNDIVLFYFAGHGIQWEDKNYLIPKDFLAIHKEDRKEIAKFLKTNAINAQDVLNTLSDRNPYVIIFLLDCCRENLLESSHLKTRSILADDSKPRGLVPMYKAGSLIAFACAPGALVDDRPKEQSSLFIKHLLNHIATPNEDILNILRDVTNGVMNESNSQQIPYVSFQLRHKNIYLFEQIDVVSNIPVNARWSQMGTTIAGGKGKGSATNQLYYPHGLSVDNNQTVIIADCYNHRIMQWKKDDTNGQVIAGGKGRGNRLDQLYGPTNVLIDKETNSLIIADPGNRRVVRWYRHNNTTQGEILIDNITCWGLALDDQRYLYVSDIKKQEHIQGQKFNQR